MDPILKYLKDRNGYGRMKDLKARGFQTRDIRKLVEDGRLVKVKAGLYRLAGLPPGEATALVEICLAMPKAVICLASALSFHGLTTFVPAAVSFAIPMWGKPIELPHLPSEPYFFSSNQYNAGIEHRTTTAGQIRVYGPEKTVCDLFRYRRKLGEDLALEGLKEYLRRRNRDLNTLMKFAQLCRVKGILSQYVKAIMG